MSTQDTSATVGRSADAVAFRMAEYEYLTKCVLQHVKDESDLERNTLLACAAIYAWLLSRPTEPPPGDLIRYAFWLPPIVVAFAILRSASLLFTLEGIYSYIKKLEFELGGQGWTQVDLNGWGWQQEVGKRLWAMWSARAFRLSLIIFWIVILLITTNVAFGNPPFAPILSTSSSPVPAL